MTATTSEQARFEPTVFGAVRRYPVMVLTITVLCIAAAVGYMQASPAVYGAEATVTVPQSLLTQDDAGEQYFDSQVLLLRSPQVAELAARIANATLNQNLLSLHDFAGENKSLEITPPQQVAPGGFGSSIVTVAFRSTDPKVAQVGVNAALQAFDEVRAAGIVAQGEDEVAAIERAILDARTRGQQTDLLKQRTQTLVNLQLDLATHPAIAWAAEPLVPLNNSWKKSAALGLIAGFLLGAGLAYARAARHRCIYDRLDPVAIYDAPLIGEIPPTPTNRVLPGRTLPMAADPLSQVAEAFRFTAGSVERIRADRADRLAVAFVSAGTAADRSSVVANVALAIAESGTPVLAVDADTRRAVLTGLLLPGSPPAEGFEQVVAGQRNMADCIESSPFNSDVTVLPAGPARAQRTTGAAYSEAVEKLITEAKASFDVVLIDSPAVLTVANAVELVRDSDAAVVVLGAGDSVQDHVSVVQRLDQVDSGVVGYVYRRPPRGPRFLREMWKLAAGPARPPSGSPSPAFGFASVKEQRSSARLPRG
ncbi:AAA family ATPase [Kribbella sp. C-35]|uniref:AAA family ATPase n=1 Tax=Kribbella sp. C-35 TaxID=2789276 RepID=UPI00397AAC11